MMGRVALYLLAAGLALGAQTVSKVEGVKDLFRTGDVYIGGQPTLETMRLLKSKGVALVVNVRSESENRDFAATGFLEEALVKELGLTYLSMPLGEKDSYTPRAVDRFAEAVQGARGGVFLHCTSGVRATNLWMAYLVRAKGSSLDAAVAVGRQMKFTLPLEDLLGARISMTPMRQ
jgi:uncharacterized protein (TIGR01244 family)